MRTLTVATFRVFGGLLLGITLLPHPQTAARDILLIDDFSGGFGTAVGLLEAEGHTVTELTDEVNAGYSRVSDGAYLSNFDMVVYSARSGLSPPTAAIETMETYIRNGGDLLVTGFSDDINIPDRSSPDLLRAIGPEFLHTSAETDHTVTGNDNYITNGPHGDFRGTTITNSNGFAQLYANTGLGTVPLVQAAGGQPDKIIFTDLPGAGGSIGAWQGGSTFGGSPAQPDFFDGGTFQGMLLNWAEGGTTSQTEVTPRVFSTAAHPVDSLLSIDLYLGDPNDGGSFVTTVGPLNVEGTMDIVSTVDGLGNGVLAVTNSSIGAENVDNILADLGSFGTLLADLEVLELYVANQTTSVLANAVDLTTAPYYAAGATAGEITIHSPTGPLASLLEDFLPFSGELQEVFYGGPDDFTDPLIAGSYDEGLGLFTDRPELNLDLDNVALILVDVPDLGEVWGVVHGELYVAEVPEPSSLVLGIIALLGLFVYCRRRESRGT